MKADGVYGYVVQLEPPDVDRPDGVLLAGFKSGLQTSLTLAGAKVWKDQGLVASRALAAARSYRDFPEASVLPVVLRFAGSIR